MSNKGYSFANENLSLKLYIRDASVNGLLTPDEEKEISAKAFGGCGVSREKMIVSNLFLVVSVARDFEGYNVPFLDLINEGNIGLMTAVERYNPERKPYAKFSSYAVWWIRHYVTRAVQTQSRTVRIPVNQTEKLGKIYKASSKLYYELERKPSTEEISEVTGYSTKLIKRTLKSDSGIISIDEPVFGDSSTTIGERLSCDIERVDVSMSRAEDRELLNRALNQLTSKEQIVIKRRFGLDEVVPETLDQIGLDFGLTRERIRQIEAKALGKLKEGIEHLECS